MNTEQQDYLNRYIKPKLIMLESNMDDEKEYLVSIGSGKVNWSKLSVKTVIDLCDMKLWKRYSIDNELFSNYLKCCNDIWRQVKW